MRSPIQALALSLLLGAVPSPTTGQDKLAAAQNQFLHEPNPVRKAKMLGKLGEEELKKIRALAESGDLDNAVKDLQTFDDQIDTTKKALEASATNAEKRPAGFKELQISVREGLHRLNDILGDMTIDEQQRFERIRKDLDAANRALIRELFPRDSSDLEADKSKP